MSKFITKQPKNNRFEITISICDDDIIHIKKTKRGKKECNYFWNNKTKEVFCGNSKLKLKKNIPSVSHLLKYKESTSDLTRTEIQIGDSIGVLFNTSVTLFLFGTIVGVDFRKKNRYLHVLPHHHEFPYTVDKVIKVKYESKKIFLLNDGVNLRYEKMAIPNLTFAKYNYEVAFAELIMSYMRNFKLIEKYARNKALPIGETTLQECHLALFNGIYDWAGKYRNHPVVVGDKERPTMEAEDIKRSIKLCLRACNRTELSKIKNKSELVKKLVTLHAELAWIHPFQDGNGRTIRLFLQIISITMGYDLAIEMLDGSTKNKKAYHYAVRRAIHDDKRNLIALFSRAINEI
ncbi:MULTISPECIES: Fic family protein [unclassified Serratia (in: enterobacteria)]|uniref:Fic family protein n=1 Tax=unclassified Serratia (in: enterobacteria) TaxID=2647522 RepID=UPI003076848E